MGKNFAEVNGRKIFSATVGTADFFSSQYQDEVLTNYTKATVNKGPYLWNKIFDETPVKKESGDVYSYGKQAMRLVETEYGNRGGMNRVIVETLRENEWRLKKHGLYGQVLVADEENADSPLDARKNTNQIILDQLKLSLENRSMKVFDETLALTANIQITSATDQFDNPASDPFVVFASAINLIKKNGGERPNNVAVSRDVAIALSNNPAVIARNQKTIVLTQGTMEETLTNLFNMKFHVGETQKMSNADSDAFDDDLGLSFLISGKMFFRYSDGTPQLMSKSFGKVYSRTAGIQSFSIDAHPTQTLTDGVLAIVASRLENDLVISSPDLGLLIYDCLTNPTT